MNSLHVGISARFELIGKSKIRKHSGCVNWKNHGFCKQSNLRCCSKPADDDRSTVVKTDPVAKSSKIVETEDTMWKRLDTEFKKEERKKRSKANQQDSLKNNAHILLKYHLSLVCNSSSLEKLQQQLETENMIKRRVRKKMSRQHVWRELEGQTSSLTALCHQPGCYNHAVDDPRWSKDYCSSECLVQHCKDVFNLWVIKQKENLSANLSTLDA